MKVHSPTFGIVFFLLIELYIHYVSGHYERHENYQSIDACHSHALGSSIRDFYLFY